MQSKKISTGNELRGNLHGANVVQLNPSQREQMVAIAAYFRVEKRGLNPNDDLADWFELEDEIDRQLKSPLS